MSAWRASMHDDGTGAASACMGRILCEKCFETYKYEEPFDWRSSRGPVFHHGMFSDTAVFTGQTGAFGDMNSRISFI